MITKTMAILIALALALASAQPVVTDQPTADPVPVIKPTPTPNYECLTGPVDWPHIPEWDNCIEKHWSDPR